jgi:hypothetical protein
MKFVKCGVSVAKKICRIANLYRKEKSVLKILVMDSGSARSSPNVLQRLLALGCTRQQNRLWQHYWWQQCIKRPAHYAVRTSCPAAEGI